MSDVKQLAKDVLTMTLHGPVPMETTAKLAQGVIDLSCEPDYYKPDDEKLKQHLEWFRAKISQDIFDGLTDDSIREYPRTAKELDAFGVMLSKRLKGHSKETQELFDYLFAPELEDDND